ncbi:MAG: hypothetical protein AB8I08_09360 [Sandaracinaceae bacterium]
MRLSLFLLCVAGCSAPLSGSAAGGASDDTRASAPPCESLAAPGVLAERLSTLPETPGVPAIRRALGLVGDPSGGVESGEAVERYRATPDCEVSLVYGPTRGAGVVVEVSRRDRTGWRRERRAVVR